MNKKKAKMPDPNVTEGFPTHHPHAEFIRKDAEFKKQRGAMD